MSLVISRNIALAEAEAALDPDCPLIGYRNVVTAGSITADAADAAFPASNLGNPLTYSWWVGTSTAEQYLTIATGEADPIDYVAIARHNFASAEIAVSIGYFDGITWVELVEPTVLPDDGPAFFLFTPQVRDTIKIKLASGAAIPRAAVVYCGKSLRLPYRVYRDHVAMPHARKVNIRNGRSTSGEFTGRTVLGEHRATSIPLQLVTPEFQRSDMDAFLAAAVEAPWFWVWRPATYPGEVGYCWLIDDPAPVPVAPANLLAYALNVEGIN